MDTKCKHKNLAKEHVPLSWLKNRKQSMYKYGHRDHCLLIFCNNGGHIEFWFDLSDGMVSMFASNLWCWRPYKFAYQCVKYERCKYSTILAKESILYIVYFFCVQKWSQAHCKHTFVDHEIWKLISVISQNHGYKSQSYVFYIEWYFSISLSVIQ